MIRNFIVLFAVASVVNTSVIVNVFDDKSLSSLLHSEEGSKTKAVNSRGDCNYQACDQLCRRLGFTGGACVGDRCKCDNFEPMHISSKSLAHLPHRPGGTKATYSLDGCNFKACDQLCRNLGFPGGACVGDKCDCDNFKEDPEVFAETTDDEKRVTVGNKKLISVKDAVLKAVDNVKDCELFACDDLCKQLNYAGGMCSDGNCMCY